MRLNLLTALAYLYLFSCNLWGGDGIHQWKRLNILFEANPATYSARIPELMKATSEIATLITTINEDLVPIDIREKIKDKKLIIVFEKLTSTDAMFFPPGTHRSTDEWIIAVNPALTSSPEFSRLVAHEYFHFIHQNVKPEELTWIREGLAQLFESNLIKGVVQSNVLASLTKSDFALEEDFDFSNYSSEQYGTTFLYFSYLQNQCSRDKSFIWDLIRTPSPGREGINEYLLKTSGNAVCEDFISTALYFSLSRLVNTYSGFEQNSSTFLMSSTYHLKINLSDEQQARRDARGFLTRLKPFAPLRLTLKTGILLSVYDAPGVSWWALEINYPYRVKEIKKEQLKTLSNTWEIGLVRTE